MKCLCACGREFNSSPGKFTPCYACQNRKVRRAILSKRAEKKPRPPATFGIFLSRWESQRPMRLNSLERESYLSIATVLHHLKFPISLKNFLAVARFISEVDGVQKKEVLARRIDHVAISLDRILR